MPREGHVYYACEYCGREWPTKEEAARCEELHRAMVRLAAEVDRVLKLAQDFIYGRWNIVPSRHPERIAIRFGGSERPIMAEWGTAHSVMDRDCPSPRICRGNMPKEEE